MGITPMENRMETAGAILFRVKGLVFCECKA